MEEMDEWVWTGLAAKEGRDTKTARLLLSKTRFLLDSIQWAKTACLVSQTCENGLSDAISA